MLWHIHIFIWPLCIFKEIFQPSEKIVWKMQFQIKLNFVIIFALFFSLQALLIFRKFFVFPAWCLRFLCMFHNEEYDRKILFSSPFLPVLNWLAIGHLKCLLHWKYKLYINSKGSLTHFFVYNVRSVDVELHPHGIALIFLEM